MAFQALCKDEGQAQVNRFFSQLIYECRVEVLEGAGDPDLHAYSVELLGKKGRPKPVNTQPKEVEEYGSPGRSGVGAY